VANAKIAHDSTLICCLDAALSGSALQHGVQLRRNSLGVPKYGNIAKETFFIWANFLSGSSVEAGRPPALSTWTARPRWFGRDDLRSGPRGQMVHFIRDAVEQLPITTISCNERGTGSEQMIPHPRMLS